MRFYQHAGTFLVCGLVLLLATGLYQRVAKPSLEYHLEHSSTDIPTPPPARSATESTPQAMNPENRDKLAQAMGDMRKNPNNAQTNISIADIFMRQKDWHNAIKFMERAINISPDNTAAWYGYGLALLGRNDFEKSAEAFEQALTLEPGHIGSMTNLIVIYRREPGKPERARELAKAVLASPKADEHAKNIASNEQRDAQ